MTFLLGKVTRQGSVGNMHEPKLPSEMLVNIAQQDIFAAIDMAETSKALRSILMETIPQKILPGLFNALDKDPFATFKYLHRVRQVGRLSEQVFCLSAFLEKSSQKITFNLAGEMGIFNKSNILYQSKICSPSILNFISLKTNLLHIFTLKPDIFDCIFSTPLKTIWFDGDDRRPYHPKVKDYTPIQQCAVRFMRNTQSSPSQTIDGASIYFLFSAIKGQRIRANALLAEINLARTSSEKSAAFNHAQDAAKVLFSLRKFDTKNNEARTREDTVIFGELSRLMPIFGKSCDFCNII